MSVTSGTDDLGDYVQLSADAPNRAGILLRRGHDGPALVTIYRAGVAEPAAVLGLDEGTGVASLTLYDKNTAAVLTADSLAKLLGLLNGGVTAPVEPVEPPPEPVPPETQPPGVATPLPAKRK